MTGPDAALLGAALAVALAAVRGLTELARILYRKAKGQNGNGLTAQIAELTQLAREQLAAMHCVDKGLDGLRYDLRAHGLEQAHLQKSVEALHRRLDDAIDRCTR